MPLASAGAAQVTVMLLSVSAVFDGTDGVTVSATLWAARACAVPTQAPWRAVTVASRVVEPPERSKRWPWLTDVRTQVERLAPAARAATTGAIVVPEPVTAALDGAPEQGLAFVDCQTSTRTALDTADPAVAASDSEVVAGTDPEFDTVTSAVWDSAAEEYVVARSSTPRMPTETEPVVAAARTDCAGAVHVAHAVPPLTSSSTTTAAAVAPSRSTRRRGVRSVMILPASR